jgi:hypothetical protein
MTMTSMTGTMGAASVAMPTALGGTQVSSLLVELRCMIITALLDSYIISNDFV